VVLVGIGILVLALVKPIVLSLLEDVEQELTGITIHVVVYLIVVRHQQDVEQTIIGTMDPVLV
jgi:hypothetical protein